MSSNVPAPVDIDAEIDRGLAKFSGSVRESVVEKLRRMVERDPEQFAKSLRSMLHQDRPSEE